MSDIYLENNKYMITTTVRYRRYNSFRLVFHRKPGVYVWTSISWIDPLKRSPSNPIAVTLLFTGNPVCSSAPDVSLRINWMVDSSTRYFQYFDILLALKREDSTKWVFSLRVSSVLKYAFAWNIEGRRRRATVRAPPTSQRGKRRSGGCRRDGINSVSRG